MSGGRAEADEGAARASRRDRTSLPVRVGRWSPARRRREALTALVPAAACALAAGAYLRLRDAEGLPPGLAAHAALMIAAWAVLLPAGAVLARYGKVTADQDFPREVDNPYWWNWHRLLQYSGVAVATAAFASVLAETGGRFATAHGVVGLAVLALGWAQVAAGWLRGTKGGPTETGADPVRPETWRGDHYDMTPRRRLFERWHKVAGWIALGLSGLALLLGAALVGSPAWLLGLLGAVQGCALAGCLDGALRGRWVDTYRALWGDTCERSEDSP